MERIVLKSINLEETVSDNILQEVKPEFNIENTQVFYSVDNTDPMEGIEMVDYIPISDSCILRFRAIRDGYIQSPEYKYSITYNKTRVLYKTIGITNEEDIFTQDKSLLFSIKDFLLTTEQKNKITGFPKEKRIDMITDYKIIEVSERQKGRIDLVAYDNYGNSDFWWVILVFNKLRDPFNIPRGLSLKVPSISELYADGSLLKEDSDA